MQKKSCCHVNYFVYSSSPCNLFLKQRQLSFWIKVLMQLFALGMFQRLALNDSQLFETKV